MAGQSDVLASTFAGRYIIERVLGRGATASVYLARDTHRGRHVAVKLLRAEVAYAVGPHRFQREIRLNEQLHHPHIVPVLDSGEHEGHLFFVLPHMEGGSLRHMLQMESSKQLPLEAAIAITRTIADALHYAHQQKLIHRDVKPENILFTSGQACLADFGIARAVERAIDESTTETGLVRGTPAYMSPEQAAGRKDYDGRTDQYSLALVLYEMLAGVQAFIGPTAEQVIAQRFHHPPRELHVYRRSISPAIEAVIERALSLQPADRYPTIADFSAALEAAPRTSIERRPSGPSVGLTRPRRIALVGTLLVIAAVFAALFSTDLPRRLGLVGLTQADSIRYAVLPVESEDSVAASEMYDRIHEGLASWSGIELASRFDVREALGSDAPVTTDDAAHAVARDLRAGRYVRTRLARAGVGFSLTAVLTDAIAKRPIREVSVTLPASAAAAGDAFQRLAAELLLGDRDAASLGTREYHAARFFLLGMEEQRAFRLERADSLLGEAVERDRDFARAAMWLAQVRAWRREIAGVDNWLPWAERATQSQALRGHEREMAAALASLGRRDFQAACHAYRSMIAVDTGAFDAWYGLGQCLDWDQAVIPDRRTASGWGYRSSYHQAVRAYTRAFELAPSMHRNFQPHAFNRLRRMLYAGRALGRPGAALPPDTTRFLGYPQWRGDSLVFIPYPLAVIRAGGGQTDREARRLAMVRQQGLFARIARAWSAAFPRNASVKEAVAVALEMAGDPAALDTLRLARHLVEEGDHRLRLAAEEVLFRVSLSRRNPALLSGAAMLADSLLAARPSPTVEEAQLLGPLAVLRGKCRPSARYAALTATRQFSDIPDIPRSSFAAADSIGILLAMGCDTLRIAAINEVVTAAASAARVEPAAIPQLEYSLFARAYLFAPPRDSARLRQVTRSGGVLVKAAYDLARADTAAVSAMLSGRRQQRGPSGTADVTPDAVYLESVLWLSLGDSATARSWPDPMLRRASWLELLLDDSYATAATMRLAVLRSQLARAAGDTEAAERWRDFVEQLWGSADPQLFAVVRSLGR